MASRSRLLLTLAIICSGLFELYSQDVLTNGLVAYYPFNGNSNDASGNGNHGSSMSAQLATDRFGVANSAYAFDGLSSQIIVQDSPSLRIPSDITVACWLEFSQNNLNVRLVGKGGDCGRNYGLWGSTKSTSWMFQQFPPEGGCVGCQENTTSVAPAVQIGRWYHIVGVRSGNVSRLYLDGVLLKDADGRSENCSPITYTGAEPLLIGAPGYIAATDNQPNLMQGKIDDIRIYNRGLTDAEVKQLYTTESGPRVDLIKAVKPSFSGLWLGTNFQLQVSSDQKNWTNQGTPFKATNSTMVYPQYWDVENWNQLFFRLQVAP